MQYLDAISNDRMISVCFQGKPFNITVIQVYALTNNAEEIEWFYEDLRYADDTTLMEESGEELKSCLMRLKEQSKSWPKTLHSKN